MLAPAILYKEYLERALGNYFYTDEMMYYLGALESRQLTISDTSREETLMQYAVLPAPGEDPIGYISYMIDYYSSCAFNFGVFNFSGRNNPELGTSNIMGIAIETVIKDLMKRVHRIEFRAISGNPATRAYDSMCKRYHGNKYVLKDIFKDKNGLYHDDYVYEFINTNIH